MYDAAFVKKTILSMGADLCGIAPAGRFNEAPEGFKPVDIFEGCRSVIVYAKRVPASNMNISSCIPYTHANNILTRQVDELGVLISKELEALGMKAVAIPSDDPYEYWEEENCYGRAILSMRHAGYLAGLGVLGRNTLLINKDFGNMIQMGAVLVDTELEGNPLAQYRVCPPNCSICLDACPVKALDGNTVNQKLCRPISNFRHEKGYILKKCNVCRGVCPNYLGLKKN